MDIVALLNDTHELASPDPLPDFLLKAAGQVARDLGLFEGWLNNGPSRGEGGLFQMGLPQGFVERLTEKKYGPRLSVFFIGRLDQVHFKLYATADQRDGTHLNGPEGAWPCGSGARGCGPMGNDSRCFGGLPGGSEGPSNSTWL